MTNYLDTRVIRARGHYSVFTVACWLILSLALLAACSGGDRRGQHGEGTLTFRFRIPGDPPSLDPIHSADLVSQSVVNNLFDPLLRLDPSTAGLTGALAERWEVSADGLSFRFVLRPGARFHNGRRVAAADVVYSFHRLLDPANASPRPWILTPVAGAADFREGRADSVEGLSAEGDSAVVIRLAEPYAPFLVQLTMTAASIVPREEVERLGADNFGQEPVGSGPFRFVSWQHDSRIVLERAGHASPPAAGRAVERVEFEVAPNISVAYEKYRAGELDLLDQLPPGHVGLVRKRTPEQLHVWPGLSVRYLGFNLTREPFRGNRTLRQAFNFAINKKAIVEVLGEGVDVVSAGAVPPGLPGHNPGLDGYPYDPERARSLLAESGYPGGEGLPELTLLYNNDPVDRRVAVFIQACLGELGVDIRLKSLEWAAFLAAVRAGEAGIFRGSWVGDFPDAHNFLHTLFHSSNWGDAGNYSRFADPEVDSLLEQAARVVDLDCRAELYRRVESIIGEEAPWIFLYHPGQVALLRPEWGGAVFPSLGIWAVPLERLYLKQVSE
ncbi:MAG: ABC transporter substrate-binding protein [Candidatus Glassbacteria bacterium]|nr:ABC transporter substrate-binding protein [Candidatus Glassbacteria bacterium]